MLKLPLLFPIIAISVGQYLEICFAYFSLTAIACFLAALVFKIRRIYLLIAWLIVGALSAQEVNSPLSKFEFKNSEIYLFSVSESPRHRRVGEVKLILELNEASGKASFRGTGRKVLCRGKDLPWENDSKLEEGDIAFVRGRFRTVKPNLNPFSFEQQLLRKGISHECKLTHVSAGIKRRGVLKSIRNFVTSEVRRILGDGEDAGLFLSMALGYEDTLSNETERAFKDTGMAHLLVISGYQISIIYFSAFTVILACLKSLPKVHIYLNLNLTCSLLAFFTALFYSVFVGIESSVVRALTATFIFLLGNMLDRERKFIGSMLVSLLFLQLIYPLSIFEPGVQLTFAALTGLALGGDGRGILSYLKSSVYASVGTAFVSYLWFGSFSLIGLLLNPLFASLISIISCNFGFLALMVYLLGIDKGGYFLSAVSSCLAVFRDFILYLSYT